MLVTKTMVCTHNGIVWKLNEDALYVHIEEVLQNIV